LALDVEAAVDLGVSRTAQLTSKVQMGETIEVVEAEVGEEIIGSLNRPTYHYLLNLTFHPNSIES
jgi:hypothetical protein